MCSGAELQVKVKSKWSPGIGYVPVRGVTEDSLMPRTTVTLCDLCVVTGSSWSGVTMNEPCDHLGFRLRKAGNMEGSKPGESSSRGCGL